MSINAQIKRFIRIKPDNCVAKKAAPRGPDPGVRDGAVSTLRPAVRPAGHTATDIDYLARAEKADHLVVVAVAAPG